MPAQDLERLATALLRKHALTTPPVPVDDIAGAEGALVVRNHFSGYESGFALREGSTWIIGVNTATSMRRQRFTVAHELGHLLLHKGRRLITDYSVFINKRDRTSSLGTDQEEIEANGFAAALLMPRSLVLSELRSQLGLEGSAAAASRDELIARLARKFSVSGEAMGYRLVNLNIISA